MHTPTDETRWSRSYLDRYFQPAAANAPEEKIKQQEEAREQADAKVKVTDKVKEEKEGRKEREGGEDVRT